MVIALDTKLMPQEEQLVFHVVCCLMEFSDVCILKSTPQEEQVCVLFNRLLRFLYFIVTICMHTVYEC